MIKCELTARNFELDDKVKEYVTDKIASLDKYLPRAARSAAQLAVVLEEDVSGREDNRYVCEAIMSVGGTQLVSREATVSIYAAIDIVEAKLKSQVGKFKDKATLKSRRHRMLGRWMRRFRQDDSEPTEAQQAES